MFAVAYVSVQSPVPFCQSWNSACRDRCTFLCSSTFLFFFLLHYPKQMHPCMTYITESHQFYFTSLSQLSLIINWHCSSLIFALNKGTARYLGTQQYFKNARWDFQRCFPFPTPVPRPKTLRLADNFHQYCSADILFCPVNLLF